MELKEAMLTRRSIRKFTQEPVPQEAVDELLRAGMAGPSAVNKQPWEFYVIRSAEAMAKLRAVAPSMNMNSSLVIIVAGNQERSLTRKDNDFWIQDCSAAIENILLTAVDLGLGACWCGLYPVADRVSQVRQVLGVEDSIVPLGLIHLGYPAQSQPARTQYDESKVHCL